MQRIEEWTKGNFKVAGVEDGEARCFCRLHKDGKKPSLYINQTTGKWFCHAGCGGGPLSTLAQRLNLPMPAKKGAAPVEAAALVVKQDKEPKYVPLKEVNHAVARLKSGVGAAARKCLSERGITPAVITKFKLGLSDLSDGKTPRIWIPAFDSRGLCANVRGYDYLHISSEKFVHYGTGFGDNRLWPTGVIEKNDEVILFEGETDCLLAHSLGLDNAITTTGGAANWDTSFTRALAGKTVLICYDIDDAGRGGASAVARHLSLTAKQVSILHLPISEPKNGDFTDYVRAVKHDRRTVHGFIGAGRAQATVKAARANFSALAELDPTGDKVYGLRAVVSGKDLTPFNVPASVHISCVPGGKVCSACPLNAGGGDSIVDIPITSNVVLKSVLAADAAVALAIVDFCSIPNRCPGHKQRIVKTQPLWDLRLSPDVDSAEEEGSEGSRRAFSMASLATNVPYELSLVACSDPKTQYALIHVLEAKSSLTSLDAWTKDGKEALLKLWEP